MNISVYNNNIDKLKEVEKLKYDFKVDLEVYNLFVEEVEKEYIEELKDTYSEFRITYNDNPVMDGTSILEVLEGESDNNQILLWGIKDNTKSVLAYWLVGDDPEDEGYTEAIEAFKEMKKYRID